MLTIVYRSDAGALLPFSALTDICMTSARKNRRLGVTGFLVEYEGVFLQVLEGATDVVDDLYATIAADPRHHSVECLIREPADERPSFGFWAMNFGPLNHPSFWRGVLGPPMPRDEFRRRSFTPSFTLDVLTRAYLHTCTVAHVNPVVTEFFCGSIPDIEAA